MKFPYSTLDIERIVSEQPADRFDSAETILLFCGFGHSGHSLVGALIDAHAHALVANELNILRAAIELDLSADDCLALMAHSALGNQDEGSWENTGYKYRIEGQSQGTYDAPLRLIGDKKAGGTARAITAHPNAVDKASALFGDRLRVICPVRNPFDNLAAAAFRRQVPLDDAVLDQYLANADATLKWQRALAPTQHRVLRHESFLRDPAGVLADLGEWLSLPFTDELLQVAAEKTRRDPNERRKTVNWDSALVERIGREISREERGPLFEGYDLEP